MTPSAEIGLVNRTRNFASGHRWLMASVALLVLTAVQQYTLGKRTTLPAQPPLAGLAALGADSVTTVAVLFRLADCGGDIESLRHWNAAAAKGVHVRGILMGANKSVEELQSIFGGADIRFPLESSTDPELSRGLRNLGQLTTPVAILIDGKHSVRLIATPSEATSRKRVSEILQYAVSISSASKEQLTLSLARF